MALDTITVLNKVEDLADKIYLIIFFDLVLTHLRSLFNF